MQADAGIGWDRAHRGPSGARQRRKLPASSARERVAHRHRLGREYLRLAEEGFAIGAAHGDAQGAVIGDAPEIDEHRGHVDRERHDAPVPRIAAARAACLAFYRLKETDKRFKRVLLNCLPYRDWPTDNTNWIYMERGRRENEVDEIVDARHLHDQLLEIVRAHRSQRGDGEAHIKNRGADLGLNYFIVKD